MSNQYPIHQSYFYCFLIYCVITGTPEYLEKVKALYYTTLTTLTNHHPFQLGTETGQKYSEKPLL